MNKLVKLKGVRTFMGQLIKLQDYVSRYEQNIYLYPSRYVRLKTQQWNKLLQAWNEGDELFFQEKKQEKVEEDWLNENKKNIFQKLKEKWLKEEVVEEPVEEKKEEEAETVFMPTFANRPQTEEMLKRQFLDQLFHFQLRWGSSTLLDQSFINEEYYNNRYLKLFLTRMPDTFLVMFAPIFQIKKAPVELDHLLITPTAVLCIKFLDDSKQSVYFGTKENFWKVKNSNEETKILNPTISLNRTGAIVQQVFKQYEISLPIKKVLVSQNGYIDYPNVPYDIELIEKRTYEQWFSSLRNLKSPLKHIQLKAAQSLLFFCQTTAIRRVEWDENDEN